MNQPKKLVHIVHSSNEYAYLTDNLIKNSEFIFIYLKINLKRLKNSKKSLN